MEYSADRAWLDVVGSLAGSDDTSYLLSDQLRILRVNQAWTTFAMANGGGAMLARFGLGTPILDVVPAVHRDWYRAGFERVIATGERWDHDYECSSPAQFRRFRMIVYPVRSFVTVTHALLVERPHDQPVHTAAPAYVADGVIRMCLYCRRVAWPAGLDRWDWVPAYVEDMPANVSHGLCPPCAAFYALPGA